MSRFTSLCSQCRHSVLLTTNNSSLSRIHHVPVRYSSLSAIHRGLRDSEKSRPQGFARGALDVKTRSGGPAKRNTSRSRRDPGWEPPSFTIKKGKKDITDEGPQPKSRRNRFNDPTESFGKRSLVYQVKHGGLRDKLEALNPSKSEASEKPRQNDFESKFSSVFRDEFTREKSPKRTSSRMGPSSRARDEKPRFTNSRSDRDSARPSRPSGFRSASDRGAGARAAPAEEPTPTWKSSIRDDLPIRIHHTTAASQFLYGRSVVEAALKNTRRKLYHLYLYAGEDRMNLVADASLQRLAERNDVEVTKITTNDGLRMMDKMAAGRPHNGCVLEASPLPQVPLKSLGPVSDGDAARPGFGVELAHQSAEEVAINGADDFVPHKPARPGRKPFFVLLDGILDPGNLGAILRSAAFLGVTGVVISKHGSSGLTPVSLKASAGASEVLPLYSVSSSLDFLQRSKDAGWMVYASVPAAPRRARGNSHLTLDRVESYDPLADSPTILVVGSEGEGLGRQVRRIADFEVSIPGAAGLLSTVDSLNVSVATGIMCAAFLKKGQGFEIGDDMDEIKAKEGDETPLW